MQSEELEEILERYRQESNSSMTVSELKQLVQYFIPVILSYKTAGIYGVSIHRSEQYGRVADIHLVYVFPEYRGKMKEVAKQIAMLMKLLGVNYIEMQATPRMKLWIERYLKATPVGYVYSLKTDDILNTLR